MPKSPGIWQFLVTLRRHWVSGWFNDTIRLLKLPMKSIVAAVFLLCAGVIYGVSPEKMEGLAFPNAVITIDGPQGHTSSHRVGEIPRDIQAAFIGKPELSHPELTETLSIGETNAGTISWRHVARTEFGDLYLIFRTLPGGKKDATSLLFDGTTAATWRSGDWRVTIRND